MCHHIILPSLAEWRVESPQLLHFEINKVTGKGSGKHLEQNTFAYGDRNTTSMMVVTLLFIYLGKGFGHGTEFLSLSIRFALACTWLGFSLCVSLSLSHLI